MFEEIDKIEKENSEVEESYVPLFEVERIGNKEVGKKIKLFSSMFFKMSLMFVVFAGLCTTLIICANAPYLGSSIILILISACFVMFISFIIIYFLFLLGTGFGALVEDTNTIKENLLKQSKPEKTVATKTTKPVVARKAKAKKSE